MDQKKLAVVAVLLAVAAVVLIAGVGARWWPSDDTPVPARRKAATKAERTPPAKDIPVVTKKAPPAPAAPQIQREDDWYGLYMQDAKIGWAHMIVEPVERGGKPFVRTYSLADIRMKSLGETRNMKIEEELLFSTTAPGHIVTGWVMQSQGAYSKRVALQGTTGLFKALITEGGQMRKMPLAKDPVTFAEVRKPFDWFRTPRAVGDVIDFTTFDLSELKHDEERLTVTAVENTVVDGVPFTYYTARNHSKREGETGIMRIDSRGRLLSVMLGGQMEVRLESEKIAKQPSASVDIFVSRIARIDKDLGDPTTVTEMVVKVQGPGVEHIREGPRQRASYDAAGEILTLSLGAAHDPKIKATDEDVRDALAEDANHPTKDPAVLALLKTALGDATTPRAKVDRLVAFVDKYIGDSYSAEPLSVLDILKVRQGDCTEHTMLFTTLARAAGIPTRKISGLMYMGDQHRAFGGHAWNEVVLDGVWVPVDATWGQTEIDATHIRMAAEDRNQMAQLALGGARIRLVSMKRRSK